MKMTGEFGGCEDAVDGTKTAKASSVDIARKHSQTKNKLNRE